MRTCPLHKTELVYETRSKHKLICSNKKCEHTEYTSLINPTLTDNEVKTINMPYWCN